MYGYVDQGYYFIMDHFEAKSMLEIWLIFESQICKHLAKFEPRFGYFHFLVLATLHTIANAPFWGKINSLKEY